MSDLSAASAALRAQMVREQLESRGITDARVLAAMRAVPREAFVSEAQSARSYDDSALPTSHGQTISQPYMVARMLELARLEPNDVVLDVGFGSGYQGAVAAQLCRRVVGIEIVPSLAERARTTLASLGIENVEVHVGDGSRGYAAAAPYQAILVAAYAPHVPSALKSQLSNGGRLVIPLGEATLQRLRVITKRGESYTSSDHDACVYVPLVGLDDTDVTNTGRDD